MEVSEKMNDANETNKIEMELNKKFESLNIKEINEKEYIIKVYQISEKESNNKNISKSICKIKIETNSETILGIGCLLKIWIHQELYYFLISNEHTIKKDIINNNNIISLYFNGELITSNINNKKRYIKSFIDNGLDISVIEIINEDNISKDYFLWNEYETDNNRLINSEIYIPNISKGELVNIKSKINKINKNEFIYLTNMENDLSGLPIFLENSINILGINKGNNKTENYCDFIYPVIDIIKDDIYKRRNNGKYINGKYIYEDDKYYIGEFKNNIPNGKGIKYY